MNTILGKVRQREIQLKEDADKYFEKFYSPVNAIGVSYPYIVGEKNTYLFRERKHFQMNCKDVYAQFYGFDVAKKIKKSSKAIKGVKMLKAGVYE